MLLETLVAIHLPHKVNAAQKSTLSQTLKGLIAHEFINKEKAECQLGAGVVLSHLCQCLRALDPQGRLRLFNASDDVFLVKESQEIDSDLLAMPQGWTEDLHQGSADFSGESEDLKFTITGQFLDRVPLGTPHLRLSVRSVYRPFLPKLEGELEDDASYERDLAYTLSHPEAFRRLQRVQGLLSQELLRPLADYFQKWTGLETHLKTRTILLPNPESFPTLLGSFASAEIRYLKLCFQQFEALRPSTYKLLTLFNGKAPIDPELLNSTALSKTEASTELGIWRGQDPLELTQ